jgi:hypothetical protein
VAVRAIIKLSMGAMVIWDKTLSFGNEPDLPIQRCR